MVFWVWQWKNKESCIIMWESMDIFLEKHMYIFLVNVYM